MANKVIFDSNVWVALFNEADTTHAKANTFIQAQSFVYLPDFILAEAATVLKYKKDFNAAEKYIEFVLNNNDIEVMYTSFHFKQFKDAFLDTKRNNLSFIDASLLAMSSEYDVITFDKVLKRAINRKSKHK